MEKPVCRKEQRYKEITRKEREAQAKRTKASKEGPMLMKHISTGSVSNRLDKRERVWQLVAAIASICLAQTQHNLRLQLL